MAGRSRRAARAPPSGRAPPRTPTRPDLAPAHRPRSSPPPACPCGACSCHDALGLVGQGAPQARQREHPHLAASARSSEALRKPQRRRARRLAERGRMGRSMAADERPTARRSTAPDVRARRVAAVGRVGRVGRGRASPRRRAVHERVGLVEQVRQALPEARRAPRSAPPRTRPPAAAGRVRRQGSAPCVASARDEVLARLDLLAHERREEMVGLAGVVEVDLQERARGRVHRRLPELVGVHLAEALEALDGEVLDLHLLDDAVSRSRSSRA